MLFPAPVWPTRATVSPGPGPERDAPECPRRVIGVPEPDILELDRTGHRQRQRSADARVRATSTGVSSSRKIRSPLAIALCSRLNFSERSCSGWKKRRTS